MHSYRVVTWDIAIWGNHPTVPVFLWENELLPKSGEMVCQLVLQRNWASHSHNRHKKNLTITKPTRVALAKPWQQAFSPVFYKWPPQTSHSPFVTSPPLPLSLKTAMLWCSFHSYLTYVIENKSQHFVFHLCSSRNALPNLSSQGKRWKVRGT